MGGRTCQRVGVRERKGRRERGKEEAEEEEEEGEEEKEKLDFSKEKLVFSKENVFFTANVFLAEHVFHEKRHKLKHAFSQKGM